jgi:RHS repeat-associated protein
VWNNLTFNGTPGAEQKFLYDGWNLIGTLNSSFAVQTSFYWGLDVSGSVQGAGGVGGLTEINDVINGVHFVGFDGNGNVSTLVKGADGSVSARYEYGPFGEVIRSTGSMAKGNPFRFSTKYQDDETDLMYYGYRYLNTLCGRWISRDPNEETALEPNLCAFVGNGPINESDAFGLYETDFHFYVIYYLLRANCFSHHDAYSIAYASQFVDDSPFTDPTELGARVLFHDDLIAAQVLAANHFVGSAPATATQRASPRAIATATFFLVDWIPGRSGDADATGGALHTLADTWAHDGFTAYKNAVLNSRANHPDLKYETGGHALAKAWGYVGHVAFEHDPDQPWRRPQLALNAAATIYRLIPNRCPCGQERLPWSTVAQDLGAQFTNRGSELQRCVSASLMIQRRFQDSFNVWYPRNF